MASLSSSLSMLQEDNNANTTTNACDEQSSDGALNEFEWLRVLKGCGYTDIDRREAALIKIESAVRSLAEDVAAVLNNESIENSNEHVASTAAAAASFKLLHARLPTLLRLCTGAPHADVRKRFTELLQYLRETGNVAVPIVAHPGSPAEFIKAGDAIDLANIGDDDLESMLVEVFSYDCSVSNVVLLLSHLPLYLRSFVKAHAFLMWGDGPLPLDWRNYIAIQAAARHKCRYYVYMNARNFLQHGGDPVWLTGIQYAPKKLQNLADLNATLCHQPWLLTQDHIKTLLRSGADSWSIGELVQAVVLLVEFHCLASFCWSVGLRPEIDVPGGHVFPRSTSNPQVAIDPAIAIDLLDNGAGNVETDDPEKWTNEFVCALKGLQDVCEEPDYEANRLHFETSETLFGRPDPSKRNIYRHHYHTTGGSEASHESATSVSAPAATEHIALLGYVAWMERMEEEDDETMCSRFVRDFTLEHEDFDIRSSEYQVFREQDYSWRDHGFSLLSRFYPAMADLIDHQFSLIRSLTDHRIGSCSDVDTGKFRNAIWYYLQRISGILHDDYNYAEVNKVLQRPLKQYMKKVACYPEIIDIEDFVNFGPGLRVSEKLHLNVLALESRKQAEILHALHAIMEFMECPR